MRRELELKVTIPDDDDREYLARKFIEALRAQADFWEEQLPMAFTGRFSSDEFVNWWAIREAP